MPPLVGALKEMDDPETLGAEVVVPFCTLMEICAVPLAPALSHAVAFNMCVPFGSVRVSSEQLYGEL